ncbi:MAG TPA: hypothetical protein VGA16_03505 [Candidatus Limnocylindria bacterium]
MALATVPEAGRVAFTVPDNGGAWLYDGRKGTVERIAYRLRAAPNGRALLSLPLKVDDPIVLRDLAADRTVPLPIAANVTFDVTADASRVAHVKDRTLIVVDPDRPPRTVFPEYRFTSARWSPSGKLLALTGPLVADDLPPGTPFERPNFVAYDLWLVDFDAKTLRRFYVAPSYGPSAFGVPAYPGLELGTWSPDERYVTAYQGITLAAGQRGEPVGLVAVDARTGASWPLGGSLHAIAWQAWRAPHTLAYVGAAGRSGWDQRRIRLWSPETAVRDLTGTDEMAFDPVWDPSGRSLYFIRAPAGPYVADDYFAGRGIGARRVARLDLETGARSEITGTPGYADEAVLASADGRDMLVLRRRTARDPLVELWLWPLDGRPPRALATVPIARFGEYQLRSYDLAYWVLASSQSYAFFDSAAWSR